MRQFNLDEYIANPSLKVVTRDGRPARVICTDAVNENPIVALVTAYDNSEVIYRYTKDGLISYCGECNLDLFFATKQRDGLVNIYRMPDTDGIEASCIFGTKEEAEFYRGDEPKTNYVATTKVTWEE